MKTEKLEYEEKPHIIITYQTARQSAGYQDLGGHEPTVSSQHQPWKFSPKPPARICLLHL